MLTTTRTCDCCTAIFSDAAAWKPLAQDPDANSESVMQEARPSAGMALLSRYFLRAAHVCLLGPILHLAYVAVTGSAPTDAVMRLWFLMPFLYMVGGVMAWQAKREVSAHERDRRAGVHLDRYTDAPWSMSEYAKLPVGMRVTHRLARGCATPSGPSGRAYT